jgi:succinyl-CoA synthetase beta subunit
MGYIIYLEVMAQKFCPPMTEMISAYHGGKTANFLRVHGEEDPEHVEQAMILLKSLDPKSLTLICENIVQSAFSFNQMISELKEKWNVKQIKKAA